MDKLETPYEDETRFIQCMVCDKSIRGESLYKIHLTTPGHLKTLPAFHHGGAKFDKPVKHNNKQSGRMNAFPDFHLTIMKTCHKDIYGNVGGALCLRLVKEDALVAAGHAVRRHTIPVFEDIKHYLNYMKLEEPIIGLDSLEEVPSTDPLAGPKYTCRLCLHTAHLSEMVHHVIGRKHRQKYVETKRPDLMTWDRQTIINQGGKIIKARAEMIERQDGRGSPVPLTKKGMVGKLNISRVPPRQKQYRDRNISQSLTKHHQKSHIPPLMDFQQVLTSREQNTSQFLAEDDYMLNSDRQMQREEDALSYEHMKEEPQRRHYKESDRPRQEYMDPDYRREYEEHPQRRAVLEPGDSRYNSRVEMPLGQARNEEYYPEDAPPYGRPYPEKDMEREFFPEETGRGQVDAQYQSSQPLYPEGDNCRWSLDRESGRHDSMKRAGSQGSSEPESKRRSFHSPMESETSSEHFVRIRDYGHKERYSPQEEADAIHEPSRRGSSNSQRQFEATRTISDIPEPFRRFLTGTSKERRKSRFSDATEEEVETAKEMFGDEIEPPNSKACGYPRPFNAVLRPEIHGIQHSDIYTESQGPHHTESYQRGVSESEDVFDMLRHVEIENAEEAGFLKNKLCDLLKEFKAKKSEKAGQNSYSRPATVQDYNILRPESDQSPRHQYETIFRQDSDRRRPEGLFQESQRERAWKEDEHITDERLQDYRHPVGVREDTRRPKSNRSRFEEVFGRPERPLTPRSAYPDEPLRYREMFQEPMHPRDNRPLTEDSLDSHTSTPPLHMDRGRRWDRGPPYSNSLDKITSTLLELVTRK